MTDLSVKPFREPCFWTINVDSSHILWPIKLTELAQTADWVEDKPTQEANNWDHTDRGLSIGTR